VTEKKPVANTQTSDKRFLRALRREPLDRPPFWLMRQAGRYLPEYRQTRAEAGSFLQLCLDPPRATEVTLQPIRRYGFDAAILFADILLIPYALGQELSFREGEGPVLDPVRDLAALRRLSTEQLHQVLAPVYETVERLAGALPHDVALIGFAGAPWTVATYMVQGRGSSDQGAAKHWGYHRPDEFQVLIDLLVDATVDYLDAQVKAGAEALQIFDTWAGSLPEPHFRRWSLEPMARIAKVLKARHPNVPIIAFARGAGPMAKEVAAVAEIDGIGLDTSMSATWAAREIQPLKTTQGNLDPLMVVAGGRAMEAEIARILSAFAGGPHVFNLGHGIVPETPPEHVGALARQVREWRG
jgi:uroporphyrinogen decarboxylase